jgi:predicted RNA binding protein YcfA (HicA-like mRNA interferase family)
LKQIKPKKLIIILEKIGFKKDRIKGSHHHYKHPDGRKTSIPIHGNESIGPGLLLKIIKQDLKMSKNEFFKLFKK